MLLTARGVSSGPRASPMTAEVSRVSGLTDWSSGMPVTFEKGAEDQVSRR